MVHSDSRGIRCSPEELCPSLNSHEETKDRQGDRGGRLLREQRTDDVGRPSVCVALLVDE